MTGFLDHYAALGIDPTADPEVITAAYRALAKKYHPDTGANTGTASAERFDEIQKAYDVLRNPESRHAYDLELLEATERELQQHLAAKRRVVVRETAADRASAAAAPPPPDLGDIRPEPAMPPKAAAAAARARKPRSLFPFLVPLLLVVLIGAGAAWLFLPAGPDAPPLPGSPQVAAVPAKPTEPAPKPAAQATAPQSQQASSEKPLFGSSATDVADAGAPAKDLADAGPEPIPVGDAAPLANAAAKADKPVFGSTLETSDPAAAPAAPLPAPASAAPAPAADPAAADPLPPPLPKVRPAQPVKQAAQQKPPAKPVQPRVSPSQQQPRARLAYQDPPQYYPEPDGYPPPPPGYEDYGPGYDPAAEPPPGFRPGGGPYRLVIFERQPGQQATAWSAGVVFKSIGKCTKVGVKTVLRRTAGLDPYDDGTRVWYECQQISLR